MKARIEDIKEGPQKGLWIIVDPEGETEEGFMYAILPEEVRPIMNACIEYLSD